MSHDSITIASRFCGPPDSGNGGYVAGLLADRVNGPARVRLRKPPPLETPLPVRAEDDGVRLLDGDDVVAEARPATLDFDAPSAPDMQDVVGAAERFTGFHRHPFRGCFVCGPDRDESDGLRIFAGPLEASTGKVAAPWVPDASLADADGCVRPEFVWAALDCPGGFAFPTPEQGTMLLGEIAAELRGSVRVGERCRLVAWETRADGRKHFTTSALYGEDGGCRALAQAIWFEVPHAA